ncbi:MAG: hypothetical protein KA712_24015 [Myxococcales bacterium]|nr:hypothetical protein [Myxococcales bacterium]
MKKALLCLCLATPWVPACGEPPTSDAPPPQIAAVKAADVLDPRVSLAITDVAMLAPFTFERVLTQLVAQSNVPGLTPLQLFRQWWDTQNPGPGLGLGPHCDDELDASGAPVLNGYPYPCRPLEGAQAQSDPFSNPGTNPDAYVPIGLFNRFDLAAKNGSFCGEYRIVFAKRSGITNEFQRNLIIFEGALRNPHPLDKLAGCRKVAKFWAELSKEKKANKRLAALEKFYFQGNENFNAAVDVRAFGDNARDFGQVRVNSFINPPGAQSAQVPWSLREFKLIRSGCNEDRTSCEAMRFVPTTVKNNAFGALFNPVEKAELAPAFVERATTFQDRFPEVAVESLLASDPTEISVDVPPRFNAAQSLSSSTQIDRYERQFGDVPTAFHAAIQSRLDTLGSPVTPLQVVRRAMTISCAGCHRLNDAAPNNDLGNGLTWAPSLGFVHVSEREFEPDDPTRHRISDALKNVFLPKRLQVLETFLQHGVGKLGETDTESDRPIKGGGRHD